MKKASRHNIIKSFEDYVVYGFMEFPFAVILIFILCICNFVSDKAVGSRLIDHYCYIILTENPPASIKFGERYNRSIHKLLLVKTSVVTVVVR